VEDGEIVELFRRREEAAVGHAAQKYGARLRAIAYGITGDGQTAEECENDTYLEAWESIPPHDPTGYLFAYLARITRHLALNACRRRSAQKRRAEFTELTAEMEECIPAPDDTAGRLEAQELGRAIDRYLRTLSEEKQIIFVRRYWYLDPVEAIARRLGVGQSKVKMTLLRCREGLREYLMKEAYDL
jgi:RNA polymerase sigma-70 factor (ECF subfamily)